MSRFLFKTIKRVRLKISKHFEYDNCNSIFIPDIFTVFALKLHIFCVIVIYTYYVMLLNGEAIKIETNEY